jgi:hypothetical protein
LAKNKPHLTVNSFFKAENFRSKISARNSPVPLQDRFSHGQNLSTQYAKILHFHDQLSGQNTHETITQEAGIYVEITSVDSIKLPLDKLDNTSFQLRSCKQIDGHEVALIFIPDSKRAIFSKKIEEYLNPEKDGTNSPKNHDLLARISQVQLANLKSFWTDAPEDFPTNREEEVWWELWQNKSASNPDSISTAKKLAERINAKLSKTHLKFYSSTVILIKASVTQLEKAPELIANLQELRKPKDTPTAIIESNPYEQKEWADNITTRIELNESISTCISILDTGVNYEHPILSYVCSDKHSETWNPSWKHYQEDSPHGSLQAGLAVFGDLLTPALSSEKIIVSHLIESGKIIPSSGANDPELYGAITTGTAYKLEINNPDFSRVYSLAITSDQENHGGKPSSWSAEIDKFTFGAEDDIRRLFIISSGNNYHYDLDYWSQSHLAEIEDPAQSWNSISVGAYTEKYVNDDPDFDEWLPLAEYGDISPTSTTSVNWAWKKQAPYKPDIVAEGGNWLVSPDSTEASEEDVVSLLTTSGKNSGQLFESGRGTSSACALVSNIAAQLMTEYPHYWPETIKGLLIHSAEWTPKMFERLDSLYTMHTPKIAKEVFLRSFGYGVPSVQKARYSASNALILISENEIQPFIKGKHSNDPTLNEMQLYQLPWPIETLQQLPPETQVSLKVTLSYFIEPNPSRRGYRERFSYQSHGLRFDTIRPGQSLDNFRALINAHASSEDYSGPEGTTEGWMLGSKLRTRGCIHSDIWTGSAADLADMHTIAVYPVGGWWKTKKLQDRYNTSVPYTLLVSIGVPDESVDIYTPIETKIEIETTVGVETEV